MVVHFLKIEKIFNKSTKTILCLKFCRTRVILVQSMAKLIKPLYQIAEHKGYVDKIIMCRPKSDKLGMWAWIICVILVHYVIYFF